ncbi:MAG: biotin/lipoyl-binding protein, partial [Gammaproteobacteria bacterium]|nr:biotin/lipoyl-binding protein [Gammaproteobacteria bacterium]
MNDQKPTLSDLRIAPESRGARAQRGGRRWWLWLIGAVVIAVAAFLFWPRTPEVALVRVQAPSGAQGGAVLNASGYVVARRLATVSSEVTGRVVEVLVEEGMPVTLGQLLARLDDQLAQSQLALAKSEQDAANKSKQEADVRLAEA